MNPWKKILTSAASHHLTLPARISIDCVTCRETRRILLIFFRVVEFYNQINIENDYSRKLLAYFYKSLLWRYGAWSISLMKNNLNQNCSFSFPCFPQFCLKRMPVCGSYTHHENHVKIRYLELTVVIALKSCLKNLN